jgi:pimeloyl-ACP methyl ester carboxylesterase
VIVFVHGLYGSKLVESKTKDVVWISFSEGLFGDRRLNLPIPGLERFPSLDVEATETLGKVRLVPLFYSEDGYQPALDFLKTQGELIPFFYDWRKNLDGPSASLRILLSDLTSQNKKVWLVAHSMGGVVAMDALRFNQGKEDWTVLEKLEGVVISAAPSYGSMAAFRNMNSHLQIGPNKRIIDAVAYSSFESIYYLLPRGPADMLLDKGEILKNLVQDPMNWQKNNWAMLALDDQKFTEEEKNSFHKYSEFWLNKSSQFSKRLHEPLQQRPKRLPGLYFFRGYGFPTASKMHLAPDRRAWYWDYDLEKHLPSEKMAVLNDDGDGSVTGESAKMPIAWSELGAQEIVFQQEHGAMMNGEEVHEQIRSLLRKN